MQHQVPKEFFWRRMHSLTGLWLAIFLIEHLLTNSQAALWIGDDGAGFIHGVNAIKNLPYLQAIEIFLIGMPILVHLVYGIQYLRTSTPNSFNSDGSTPSLPEYKRNKAYTWQRITSWMLLFLLVGHIIQMRFVDYPSHAKMNQQEYYMVRLDLDAGLVTVADRLGVVLYDQNKIQIFREQIKDVTDESYWQSVKDFFRRPEFKDRTAVLMGQKNEQQNEFLDALEVRKVKEGQVIAVAKDFGTAELLMVRETFKMPIMLVLYTIFVMAAVFHAYNGLWTFLITWGVTLTPRSQEMSRKMTNFLMFTIGFMGFAAIWGTYWVNLRM